MTTEAGRLTPVGVGDVLAGKYEVERVLGSGGMGVVVAAKHLALGERVAIKFLLPQALKKREVVQRFEREARAAVRIKSEHVARIFDVGKLDDGAPYMVMELLHGSDLGALLKTRGAVPIEVAVDYVLQTCEAIAEAHSLGIVHRDLKPANLFVTSRADGSHVVKVIDFGISKVVEAEGEVEMTKTDVMMGSPVYMAPEQMISAKDVDVRADVWSLGIILFYLVMGSQPFKGNTVTQLYASILEGPPQMRDARPDVPAALEAAVVKCLHANPRDRWSNVAELALAIAPFGATTSRISADRVARTLGVEAQVKVAEPAVATQAITAGTPLPGASPISSTKILTNPGSSGLGAQGVAGAGAKPATSTPPPPETTGSSSTEGSWAGTQGPTARARSRNTRLAVGGAALLSLLAAGAIALTRGGSSEATTAAPDASLATSTTTSSPATVVPAKISNEDAAGSGSAITTSPPTASASTAAIVSAPSASQASPTPTAAGATSTSKSAPTSKGSAAPRPTATTTATKSKTDLFSDPH